MQTRKNKGRRKVCRPRLVLHPLFLAVGVWYSFTGDLFLFLLSCLVALQHECAHAFVASKLGYTLNKIVLMPYGAVIDGDLRGISLKDEITVAIWGPLCNLFTALFFGALWWFYPTAYAFTDVACFSSLSIALVNLLPAYPLDGGRIFKCVLERAFYRREPNRQKAEKRANAVARGCTFLFSFLFLAVFTVFAFRRQYNFTLLTIGLFLIVGGLGNKNQDAVYEKISFFVRADLTKGLEIRRVAVLESCPIKDALQFIERGKYLVLEVYSKRGALLCALPQNALAECFAKSESPYEPVSLLAKRVCGGKEQEVTQNFSPVA
ncbi:MAG: hypothetical protein E7381_05290 [Clostridiales bacterium]|nr:hypothetical protein [Clostridiales bacterium]